MDRPTLVLAGGGTAGHVNPLLAAAAELGEFSLVCLGTAEGLESRLIPEAGYTLHEVAKIPLPRRVSRDLLRLPGALAGEVRRLKRLFRARDVRAVVGFGGYVSTPAYLAARQLRIPVVIHEQNARPGLANRLGARFAAALALTFASTPLTARRGVTRTIGLPLRPAILTLARQRAAGEGERVRREAAARFGLDPDRPILLVTGGSLGAATLNDAIVGALPLLPADLQVLHLTGRGKDATVAEAVAGRRGYVVLDYLSDMEAALAVADLVVCRAGAGTVAEMCALGLPAIYVPLAIGNGEQRLNAADVVAAGGARLVPNAACTSRRLAAEVEPLLADDAARATMAAAAAACGNLDAAADLAAMVKEVVR